MKKLLLLLTAFVLCSCSNQALTPEAQKEKLTYNLTAENYEKFFKVDHSLPNKKTTVSPLYNRHISYNNVVFNFKTDYSVTSSRTGTYNYSVNVDETGNGQASNIDITSYTTSTDYQFVSVEGVVSFNDDYTTFETIEKFNKNRNRKEDIGVYYNLLGSTKSRYVIKFKVDSNVSETADTDAFFLIESVKVKFTATVNNSTKDFEYDLKPNFFGIAEIPTDDEFSSSITNTSFKYTNGYYLGY